jgi:hypothetical protein
MSIKASNQPLRRSRRRLFPQRSPSRPLLPYQNPSILAAIQERPGPRLSGGWMEFTAMKRRELLDLCRQHGLATRGSKADLAASLAGAISVRPPKPSLLPLCSPMQKVSDCLTVYWGKNYIFRSGSFARVGRIGHFDFFPERLKRTMGIKTCVVGAISSQYLN